MSIDAAASSDPSAPSEQPLLGYAPGVPRELQGEIPLRDAELLVAFNGTTLPAACVLCGKQSSETPVKLVFTWDASFTWDKSSHAKRAIRLQLRQKAFVMAFLCADHKKRWQRSRKMSALGIAASVTAISAGMTLAIISQATDSPEWIPTAIWMMVGGLAFITVAMFYLVLASRTLSCKKIHEGYLYLDGAAEHFLEKLPLVPALKEQNP